MSLIFAYSLSTEFTQTVVLVTIPVDVEEIENEEEYLFTKYPEIANMKETELLMGYAYSECKVEGISIKTITL